MQDSVVFRMGAESLDVHLVVESLKREMDERCEADRRNVLQSEGRLLCAVGPMWRVSICENSIAIEIHGLPRPQSFVL